MNLIYGLLLIATLCVSAVSTARADDAPLIVETVRQAAVYGEPSRSERPVARIYFGAVLSVRPAGQKNGCRPGWLRIEGGGYICRSAVKESKRALGPAPDDRPDIDSGLERWKVEKGGAVSYASELDFQHRRKDVFLFRGTERRLYGDAENPARWRRTPPLPSRPSSAPDRCRCPAGRRVQARGPVCSPSRRTGRCSRLPQSAASRGDNRSSVPRGARSARRRNKSGQPASPSGKALRKRQPGAPSPQSAAHHPPGRLTQRRHTTLR